MSNFKKIKLIFFSISFLLILFLIFFIWGHQVACFIKFEWVNKINNFINFINFDIIFLSLLLFLVFCIFLIFSIFLFINKKIIFGKNKFDILYEKISNDIKYSMLPPSLDVESEKMVDLARDVWRLKKHVLSLEDKVILEKLLYSVNRIEDYYKKHNVKVVDFTGSKYNQGMNLEVVHTKIDESNKSDEYFIKEVLEPAVFINEKMVYRSKIVKSNFIN